LATILSIAAAIILMAYHLRNRALKTINEPFKLKRPGKILFYVFQGSNIALTLITIIWYIEHSERFSKPNLIFAILAVVYDGVVIYSADEIKYDEFQ